MIITAEDVAKELNCTGRKLRGLMREQIARSKTQKHQRDFFTRAEADEVKRRYRIRFG